MEHKPSGSDERQNVSVSEHSDLRGLHSVDPKQSDRAGKQSVRRFQRLGAFRRRHGRFQRRSCRQRRGRARSILHSRVISSFLSSISSNRRVLRASKPHKPLRIWRFCRAAASRFCSFCCRSTSNGTAITRRKCRNTRESGREATSGTCR